MRHTIAVILAAAAVWAGPASRAADWPHLRGPNYNGVSADTGLADSWPEGGPPVLWRIEVGQGYSGIVAVGDKLFTQMQSLSGQYVVCLDAATGRRLWRRRYGYPWEPEGHWPGPYATPTVSGGRVYFAGCYGLVGCLDAADGRMVWSVNVTEKFEGDGTEYGYAGTPLVVGGKVFLPVGGRGASVVALNARDGSVVWQVGDEPASYSPAYPITVGGRRQIVTFLQNVVIGHDTATGRQLWQHRWSRSYDEHAAWPVYAEPFLLTAAAFRGGATVLRLDASGATVAWKSKVLSNDIFSSLILGGHIYGFDLRDLQPRHTRAARGQFKCIDVATGYVRWATDATGHANVLAVDGKLILLNDTGDLILARATPERYEELARTRLFEGQVCWTTPTLHRKRLYARRQSQLVCVYLGDPKELSGTLPTQGAQAAVQAGVLAAMWSRYEATCTGASLYAPALRDLARWYAVCMLGVFAPAVVLAGLARVVLQRARGGRVVFCVSAFAIGLAGTVAFSAMAGEFVFTWPAALFVAYQAVLCGVAWARVRGGTAPWLARAMVVLFLGVCVGYVALCANQHMPNIPVGYGFLVGILPAFPVAVVAARRVVGRDRPVADLLWAAASFTVYFWTSGQFTMWKT